MGLLEGKKLLVTGVLVDSSIAFHVARLAQEQGADVVLTRNPSGVQAAKVLGVPGIFDTDEGAVAYGTNTGVFAYHPSSKAEFSASAFLEDGNVEGWAESFALDVNKTDVVTAGQRAAEKAEKGVKAQAIEAGEYPVVFRMGRWGDMGGPAHGHVAAHEDAVAAAGVRLRQRTAPETFFNHPGFEKATEMGIGKRRQVGVHPLQSSPLGGGSQRTAPGCHGDRDTRTGVEIARVDRRKSRTLIGQVQLGNVVHLFREEKLRHMHRRRRFHRSESYRLGPVRVGRGDHR